MRPPKIKGERVSLVIPAAELRLVRRLARQWRMAEADVLRLAVWAYVCPLVPSLKAPHERPPLRAVKLP